MGLQAEEGSHLFFNFHRFSRDFHPAIAFPATFSYFLYQLFFFQYLEHYCQSCFFAAIIVTQVADGIICKTRRNTIFRQVVKFDFFITRVFCVAIFFTYFFSPLQGMTNWVLNAGLLFAVALGCTLLYTPGLYEYLLMPPIQGIHWLPGVPYALLIIVFDEIRRLILRHRPGGWVEREFYY